MVKQENFKNAINELSTDKETENVFAVFAEDNSGFLSCACGNVLDVVKLMSTGIKLLSKQVGIKQSDFVLMMALAMNAEEKEDEKEDEKKDED